MVGGVTAVVLQSDAAELREEVVPGKKRRYAEERLIVVVVADEVFTAVADISNAERAVPANFPLKLQIPLADAGDYVGRKNGNDAHVGRVVQIQGGEVAAGEGARGIGGNELRLRAGGLAGQRAGESDAESIGVADGVLAAKRRI